MKRALKLNESNIGSGPIFYMMSRDQRTRDNHALLEAQHLALEYDRELIVLFNLVDSMGVRASEHFHFMLDGLEEVAQNLHELNISFHLLQGDFESNILEATKGAGAVVFDFSPLRWPRAVQKKIASQSSCAVFCVDTHNVIPLWVLSDKEEFAAHTIRGKVHKNLTNWLVDPGELQSHPTGTAEIVADWNSARAVADKQSKNGNSLSFSSGERAAHKALTDFIATGLDHYADERNVPTLESQSDLSPYLHFGQISALRITLEIIDTCEEDLLLLQRGKLASYEGEPTRMDGVNAFVEELIVRKELADNYCFYNDKYDALEGAKPWAKETLESTRGDERDHVYSLEEWEKATTHDDAWNAAQKQMMKTGKMHGYMRMYWAKKILEWSESPEEAVRIAVYLNDHYSIDGGDPNGYTGILWSIAGVHDRPWFERPVFGKIRYMNRGGLERRFDVEEYIKTWT